MSPNRMRTASLFVAFLICVGQVIAACPNCEDGMVRAGRILYPCPLCCGENESDFPHGLKEKGTSIPDKKPDTSEQVQAVLSPEESVVRIVSENKDSTSYGSGVVVMYEGQVLVLTARHVVFDDDTTEGFKHTVHYQDGTTSPARLVKDNSPFDVAALEVDVVAAPALVVAEKAPALGEKVTIVGYGSHGSRRRAASGRVDGRWKPVGNQPMDRFSSSVGARQGDSGGPVFSEDGKVVGILSSSDGGRTWSTNCERIRKILAGEESKQAACPDGKCRKR